MTVAELIARLQDWQGDRVVLVDGYELHIEDIAAFEATTARPCAARCEPGVYGNWARNGAAKCPNCGKATGEPVGVIILHR